MINTPDGGLEHFSLRIERSECKTIGLSGVMEIRFSWITTWDLDNMTCGKFKLAFLIKRRCCFHILISIFKE